MKNSFYEGINNKKSKNYFMEDIREAAWTGDIITLSRMIEFQGVDVNERHKINGTTALHWAVKGGYTNAVSYLLSKGADPKLEDNENRTPLDLAKKASISIKSAIGIDDEEGMQQLRFEKEQNQFEKEQKQFLSSLAFTPTTVPQLPQPKILNEQKIQNLKVPITIFVKESGSKDVIEVDLEKKTYDYLYNLIISEFNLKEPIKKIRKVPNILIRKDKDVERISSGITIEYEL